MERFRSYRETPAIRDQEAQVFLAPEDFIVPYFVVEGESIKAPIPSLWDVYHFSIDVLLIELESLASFGINKILLFGVVEPGLKDPAGTAAYQSDSLIARAVFAIKARYPHLIVMTDVCLCGYTDHGHCGLLSGHGARVDNDTTLPWLAEIARMHARAGADYVCPSAMMDGQVRAIRQRLDQAGYSATRIMGYSAKYASGFYGPFRDAVESSPRQGDRRSYQMDYRNRDQALPEVRADLAEGADVVMVKPAYTYLDVIARVRDALPEVKLAAYLVSGEYMMIKSAAAAGVLDEQSAMREVHTAIKRAGADWIISYGAKSMYF